MSESGGFRTEAGGSNIPAPVVTGIFQEERSFQWKIEKFDLVRKSVDQIKKQRFEFTTGNSYGQQLTWQCYLSDDVKDGKTYMGAFFLLWNKPAFNIREVNVSFVMKIKSKDAKKKKKDFFCGKATLKNMMEDEALSTGWGFQHMIQQDAALNTLPLTDDGSLLIELQFIVYHCTSTRKVNLDVDTQLAMFETKSFAKLSRDLDQNDLLANESMDSPTKIVSNDKVEFPANRGVLSARSAVFNRMFQSGMKEAQTGIVELDDLSSKSVNVLLRYIATGRLDKDWKADEIIEELVYAADKYELGLLKEFLDDVLGCVCNIGNFKRLGVLAMKLGMKKAEKDLFERIKADATGLEDLVFDSS